MVNDAYLKRKVRWLPAISGSALLFLTFVMALLPTAVFRVHAQAENGIAEPVSGSEINGVVVVVGTAVHPDYLRYELAFRNLADPAADWVVFAEGSEPVNNGALAVWDTTVGREIGAPVFPDGRYQLRLRVVKTDYNYDEYFVTDLVIANAEPTPTPTPESADEAPAAPATLAATAVFSPAEPLPSLTPFPTSTPLPGPVDSLETAVPVGVAAGNEGGLFGQWQTIDTGRFGRAFWFGVGLAAFLFALLALYLLLRAIGRRLWQWFWTAKNQ